MAQDGGGSAGLILAAGAGARMGGPKALLRWDGEPLVQHQCATVRPVVDEVVVVTGAAADHVTPLIPEGIRTVHNPDWRLGMAGSLRVGVAALATETQVVVIVPVDQPLITTELVRHALRAHRPSSVVVIDYGGHWGHPMVWDLTLLEQALQGLTGDRGARGWLAAHPDRVIALPRHAAAAQWDLDTPGDLARLRQHRPGDGPDLLPGG